MSDSTRAITLPSLYTQYIQKSTAFLFPWLELKGKGRVLIQPVNTYLRLKGIYQAQDHKLICSYNQEENDPAWVTYQEKYLLTHPLLDIATPATIVRDNEVKPRTLYIFDLGYYQQDIVYFLQGQYSKLSPRVKKLICSHYGVTSSEWAYIESYLYPSNYFRQYSRLLGIDEKDLREIGELCDRYNEQKETFPGTVPDSFVEQLVL